jgi:hypothetical protein
MLSNNVKAYQTWAALLEHAQKQLEEALKKCDFCGITACQ